MYRDRHLKRLGKNVRLKPKGLLRRCADCNTLFVGNRFLCPRCRENRDKRVKYSANPEFRASENARSVAYKAKRREEAI